MSKKPLEAKRKNEELLARGVRDKNPVFKANPSLIVLEPTNRCNLACGLCARNYWDKNANPLTDMSLETLRAVEPFLKTASSVYAFGHGEPTLGKNFREIVLRAKSYGCEVQFTTNGFRLDDELIDFILESKTDIVNVSLDALEPDSSKIRRGVDPAKALRRLHRVWEKKTAAGQKTPETGIAFTADRENLGELPNLIDAMAAVGASVLIISHFVAWSVENHSLSAYHVEADFRSAFAKAVEKGRAKGITVILPFDNMDSGFCPHPMSMFFVRASGEVWPCCNAVFRQDRYSFPAGNVHESALRDIWNGEVYQALRRDWWAGRAPVHCRICPLAADKIESHLRNLES